MTYHGVLGPCAGWRDRVVPDPPGASAGGPPLAAAEEDVLGAGHRVGWTSTSLPASSDQRRPEVGGVSPVDLPPYLGRPQMAIRPAADSIEIRELDHWGKPLSDGTTGAVAVNLARLLPECRVVPFPWRSTEEISYEVVLDIEQVDGRAVGNVALVARWARSVSTWRAT